MVLLHALIVNNLQQSRQLVDIEIDRENQVNILGYVMTNDHDFAVFTGRRLWSHDLQASFSDALNTNDLRVSELEKLRISFYKSLVPVVLVFLDAEVMALDVREPVPCVLAGSYASNVAGVKNGETDLSHKLGNPLIGLNVEANEYNVVLRIEGSRGCEIQRESLDRRLLLAEHF